VLNIGVQLFFVLSGYVLALPFAGWYRRRGRAVSLKRYFLRRLMRLEPPYVASLILLLLVKILAGRSGSLLPHFAASLGYVHNLVYAHPSEINFVAWSLEIEVQFYLLAPLLSFLFFRNESAWKRRAIIALCCVGCGAVASLLGDSPRVALSLVGQMPYFLAGLLLADMATSPVDTRWNSAAIWDVVCVCMVLLLFYWIYLGWALPYVGPLTVAAVYWSAFRSRCVLQCLRARVVSTIGGMCYSIYLLHNYVIAVSGQFTERLSAGLPFTARLIIQACIIAPLVVLTSAVFFLIIERPCMRPDWPSRLVGWIRSGAQSVRRPEDKKQEQLIRKIFQE
jgi:peptidoglycan/LPS O-acetylase OafA/YrhL